jgi:hypothetical protein
MSSVVTGIILLEAVLPRIYLIKRNYYRSNTRNGSKPSVDKTCAELFNGLLGEDGGERELEMCTVQKHNNYVCSMNFLLAI